MARNIYAVSYQSKKRLQKHIWFVVFYSIILLTACSFIISYLFFPVHVKTSLMEPTLEKNDILFVTPLASPLPKSDGNPFFLTSLLHSFPLNRGNLVYLKPLSNPTNSFIKQQINLIVGFFTFQQYFPFSTSSLISQNASIRRLVAIPGDTVFMKDYVLYVKPANEVHYLTEFELSEKIYDLKIEERPSGWDLENGVSGMMDIFVLGPDEYFVLADNRSGGTDSRIWGSIHASVIGGKVLFRYFPFSKFSGI